jgi:hypothetical protein
MSYHSKRTAAMDRLVAEKGPVRHNQVLDLLFSKDGEGFEIRLNAFGYYIERVVPTFLRSYTDLPRKVQEGYIGVDAMNEMYSTLQGAIDAIQQSGWADLFDPDTTITEEAAEWMFRNDKTVKEAAAKWGLIDLD